MEWYVETTLMLKGSKIEKRWTHILAMILGKEVDMVEVHSTRIWHEVVKIVPNKGYIAHG